MTNFFAWKYSVLVYAEKHEGVWVSTYSKLVPETIQQMEVDLRERHGIKQGNRDSLTISSAELLGAGVVSNSAVCKILQYCDGEPLPF